MDVKLPDGRVITNVPEGTTQKDLMARLQGFDAQTAASREQPSVIDRVVASPVGRFTQENIVEPAIGLGTLVARQFSDDPRVNTILDKENAAYEGALARNRNTPGYAAERAKADRAMADNGASAGAFLPSVQSAIAGTVGLAGGLDSSNAMADAASAKQRDFAKEHPFLSLGEGLVGSLTGMPAARAALPAKVAKAVTPSVEALKAEARKAYQVVDQSGLKVSAPAVQDLVTQIQTDVAKRGFHPMLHSKSAAVLDALGKAAGDQSIQDMEILRRVAKEGAKASDKADRAMARVVQDHIDNFMENLKPEQLSSAPDPQAQEALVTARDLWTKASRGEIIDDALEKAKNAAGANYTQAGYATAVRQRFRQIANNDRAMARFTPQQRETIKQIVRGGKTENILRLIGKLAVRGPVSGAASAGAGFAAFGPAGAFVLPAIGEAAKAGSTALTLRAARRASELARGAEVVKEPLLRAPNQLPSAAYGIPLVNSLIQDQQRNALAAYGQ
jgi:hypothetical protein